MCVMEKLIVQMPPMKLTVAGCVNFVYTQQNIMIVSLTVSTPSVHAILYTFITILVDVFHFQSSAMVSATALMDQMKHFVK